MVIFNYFKKRLLKNFKLCSRKFQTAIAVRLCISDRFNSNYATLYFSLFPLHCYLILLIFFCIFFTNFLHLLFFNAACCPPWSISINSNKYFILQKLSSNYLFLKNIWKILKIKNNLEALEFIQRYEQVNPQ